MKKKGCATSNYFFLTSAGRTGRGVLIRVNPGGVALESSESVVEGVTQVSVKAKRFIF
jgi:hypothetical protein